MTASLAMPPCSIEAEEATIGAMLVYQDSIIGVKSVVNSEDFYIIKNRIIFDSICSLHEHRQPVDIVTVVHELERRNQLQEIGGAGYLSHLINTTPSFLNGDGYCQIVAETAKRRRLIEAASNIAKIAYDEQGNIEDQISQARSFLASIDNAESGTRTVQQVAGEVYDQLVEWHEHPLKPGQVRGLSCGLPSLDKMLGGFEKSKLYILAARPAMGKSSLAFQMGFDAAKIASKPVIIFSIEMSADEVIQRWISRLIRVPFDEMKRGNIPEQKWDEIIKAYTLISELPMVINDNARMTISKIESEISRYQDLGLVIIDHIGLMSDPLGKNENETHRLGRISWAFKQFAKIYKAPVLAVSQLNRGVEGRRDKRPLLSDLRESGDIEQNADVVLMLYRDDYYNANSKTKNICEVIPRKVRSGDSSAMAELFFNKSITEFGEVAR